jgi:hypothetical protein
MVDSVPFVLFDVSDYVKWVKLHGDDDEVKNYLKNNSGKRYIDAYQEIALKKDW